ncbi:MAG: hypothetical protein D6743_01370, partial [Calditrichaeota bacterium]
MTTAFLKWRVALPVTLAMCCIHPVFSQEPEIQPNEGPSHIIYAELYGPGTWATANYEQRFGARLGFRVGAGVSGLDGLDGLTVPVSLNYTLWSQGRQNNLNLEFGLVYQNGIGQRG